MTHLRALLTPIRHLLSYPSSRGRASWLATVLIALLIPLPIAAPLLLARSHRPKESHDA
jgi:hypothetical protein